MSRNTSDSEFSREIKNRLVPDEIDEFHSKFLSQREDLFLDVFSLRRRRSHDKEALGQNLDRHYETIYSGCSETYGDLIAKEGANGVIDMKGTVEHNWGTIVSNHVGGSFANLATGGASAVSIVDEYMYQIKNFGAPKNLFILFPKIDSRIPFIGDSQYLVSETDPTGDHNPFEYINATRIGDSGDMVFSKRPHKVQEVVSKTYATYLNIQAILTLETLCTLTKTNLMYSTWSKETSSVLEAANSTAEKYKLEIPFKNYIKTEYYTIGTDCDSGADRISRACHSKHSELEAHPHYYIGRGGSHMGVHAHRHVAENFIAHL